MASHLRSSSSDARTPLLFSDRSRLSAASEDFISRNLRNWRGHDSSVYKFRQRLQHFLVSKWGHYSVILLVTLDVACIFADFLLSIHVCEHSGEKGTKLWSDIDEALDTVSLVFSCLFMAELLASIFAFGPGYGHPCSGLRGQSTDDITAISNRNSMYLMHWSFSQASSLISVCMGLSRRWAL